MINRTYNQLFDFINEGNKFLESDIAPHDEGDSKKKGEHTKLGYAINKVISMNRRTAQEYGDRVQDIQTENAATDKDKIILREANGNFRYTTEGLKACNKRIRDLASTEIEVHEFICTDVPELSFAQREAFDGFVLANEDKKE